MKFHARIDSMANMRDCVQERLQDPTDKEFLYIATFTY
jgi:hypothetical protein